MPTGAASASAQIVLSPMTGTLVEVLVKAGDKVEVSRSYHTVANEQCVIDTIPLWDGAVCACA